MAARVMTFDEVRRIETNEDFVWLEVIDAPDYHMLFHLKVNFITFDVTKTNYAVAFTVPFDNVTFDANLYGKDWRIWTEKPSYDQQHATRWNK